MSVTYTATLSVREETVLHLSSLPHAERQRRGTRKDRRSLGCFKQAVLVIRWFCDATRATQLAPDNGIGKSTAYDYLHEGIAVLAARAPKLESALLAAKMAGYSHINIDGTLIETDRCRTPGPTPGVDLWWSAKHANHGGNIQVGYYNVLFELLAPCQQPSLLVQNQAAAIEDQLVLTSHQVVVGENGDIILSPLGYHLLPGVSLAEVIGRGADIDDDLRPRVSLDAGRADLVPDILANIDADADAGDGIDGAAVTGAEVAVFVEDAVVGQEYLVVNIHQPAVVDDGGGVIDSLFLVVGETGDDSDTRRSLD